MFKTFLCVAGCTFTLSAFNSMPGFSILGPLVGLARVVDEVGMGNETMRAMPTYDTYVTSMPPARDGATTVRP